MIFLVKFEISQPSIVLPITNFSEYQTEIIYFLNGKHLSFFTIYTAKTSFSHCECIAIADKMTINSSFIYHRFWQVEGENKSLKGGFLAYLCNSITFLCPPVNSLWTERQSFIPEYAFIWISIYILYKKTRFTPFMPSLFKSPTPDIAVPNRDPSFRVPIMVCGSWLINVWKFIQYHLDLRLTP